MPENEKKASILVVDDDQTLADNLVEYLQRLGYRAVPAYGGREGLETFREGDFQLLVTDLMMPEMGGMELLEAVKTLDPHATVLVVTGYGTIESAVEAIHKGAFDLVPKPFKLSELEVIIQRALERRALAKQLGMFRGLTLALIISVPLWLLLGILLMWWWRQG